MEGQTLHIEATTQIHSLPITRLYRPSSFEVREAAAPDKVLVLISASAKAIAAANPFNHIVVHDGNYRLVLPGVALLRETALSLKNKSPRARLQGRTGLLAETLLLAGKRPWSVHELARASGVSQTLAHRVLDRLEKECCLEIRGSGPDKTRTLANPMILAEVWSQEEVAPKVTLWGHLYGASPDTIARKALQICPEGAIGGLLAANDYAAVLTRIPFPIRFWVPEDFWLGRFREAGMEETGEGANIEIVQAKGDTWRPRRDADSFKVSAWRAWLEVSHATGRGQELAEELLKQLQTRFENGTSHVELRA